VTVVAAVAGGVAAYAAMPERSRPTGQPVAVPPAVTTASATPRQVASASAPAPGCDPATRFTINATAVRDNTTCLVWQRKVATGGYTFAAARTHCTSIGGGWRLPTRTELASIIDPSGSAPMIDRKAFPNTPPDLFWASAAGSASASASPAPPRSWTIDFATGKAADDTVRSTRHRVRCVRAG
jgi:hypothetical protein